MVSLIGDLMVKIEDAWAPAEAVSQARGVQAELGWALRPEDTGHGYATEAVEAALRVCFEDLGLRRVTASCFAANTASYRLMERGGYAARSAHGEECAAPLGEWMDGYGYALLADEWRRRGRQPLVPFVTPPVDVVSKHEGSRCRDQSLSRGGHGCLAASSRVVLSCRWAPADVSTPSGGSDQGPSRRHCCSDGNELPD